MTIISISIRTSLLTILHLSIVELYFTSCFLGIMILKQQRCCSAYFPHPGFPLIARWEQSLCREWSHFFSSCCSAVDDKTAGCSIQTDGRTENKFPQIIYNKWPTISANADITFPNVVRDLLMFAPSCITISRQLASETKYRIQSIKQMNPNVIYLKSSSLRPWGVGPLTSCQVHQAYLTDLNTHFHPLD